MKNQAGAKTLICHLVLRMTLNMDKFLNVVILSLFFLIFFYRFVEIMAPVFSRDAWRCVWHLIQACVLLRVESYFNQSINALDKHEIEISLN